MTRAIVTGKVRVRAVAKLVMAKMGNSHIANAAFGPQGDIFNGWAQRKGVFHPYERDKLAVFISFADLRSGCRECHPIFIGFSHQLDAFDAGFGNLTGLLISILCQISLRRIDNKEGGVQTARAHFHQIRLQICRFAWIDPLHIGERHIHMGIQRQRGFMDLGHIALCWFWHRCIRAG